MTERPTVWRLRSRNLSLNNGPLIMGILNVTPDSFSDGGKFFTPQLAIDQALAMEDAGADILDIGGESTRPYAQAIDVDEELQRVVPVIEALQNRIRIPISIDTTKARVAAAAISVGAEIVNDISGLQFDPAMIDFVASSKVAVCVMHIQGTVQDMQDDPSYGDVVQEILDYLRQLDKRLLQAGIEPSRICLDPGIGFGKSHEHNIELLHHAERFLELSRPILIGHSRKGFIAKILGGKSLDRSAGTLGVSLAMAAKGIQILRVHDVALTYQALQTFNEVWY